MAFDGSPGRKAAVIGAGVNGLVAAAALARRGFDVTVFERAASPGGMLAGPGGPLEIALFARGPGPAALAELGATAEGLGLGPALPTVALDPEGRHVLVEGAEARFADGGAHPAASAWRDLSARLDRFAGALAPYLEAPPSRNERGIAPLAQLARLALRVRRLGAPDLRELLRLLPGAVADLATEKLGEGPLAGLLAFEAVLGSRAGPMAHGTVAPLLLRRSAPRRAEGGMAALAARIAEAAEARGARIRCGAAVAAIELADDRAAGLRLSDGERIEAGLVLSSLAAGPTLALAGPQNFDIEACRRIRGLRAAGAAARVDLAFDERPEIPGLDPALHGARLVFAPSVRAVERAHDPVKYGRVPTLPAMEGRLDETAEGPRLSLTVQCVPPEGGEAARRRIVAAAKAALDAVAPGLGARAREVAALAPAEIGALTGAPGGHWSHGEIALDRLLTLRPAIGLPRSAMGPDGLFLCGAGSHPGGDMSGLQGRNGALAALAAAEARR